MALWPILAPSWADLVPKWCQNGPKSGPKKDSNKKIKFCQFWAPKWTPKLLKMAFNRAQSQEAGAILKALVSKVAPRWLKIAPSSPRWPLGSLLGSSDAVLESLGPPKSWKKTWFFQVFANAGFRYFEALDVPLGPILASLGPIWSQNRSKNGSSNCSKSILESLKRGPLQAKNH